MKFSWLTAMLRAYATHPKIEQGTPFKSYARGRTVDQIVLHESVTATAEGAVKVLTKRSLGVHLVVDPAGTITQHVPLEQACSHAGGAHNRRSVAIEVINAYYGHKATAGDEVINAVWAHKGRYIFPPAEQLEGVWRAVKWVTSQQEIPLDFPALESGDVFRWGRSPRSAKEPGIMAHHRWHHADGLVPEHYCLLRSLGFTPDKAYTLTKVTASGCPASRLTTLPTLTAEEAG